ncbi:hypothetical protein [Segatella copri]|uniref:hypothetical protein n=1 Tax=Segatella copri TaxID=165179 RepID=UPI003F6E8E85
MKKVLTLVSALSMVAGSAVANDFDWTGLEKPQLEAGTHFVKGTKSNLTYENQAFSFKVTKGDKVQLGVNGENLDITVNGSKLSASLEGGKISFVAEADGDVVLKLGTDTAIKSIYVESDNYRKAENLIKTVGMAAVNKATVDIADYSTMIDKDNQNLSFDGFFTSVKEEINLEAQKVAQMEAELVTAKAENTVKELLAEGLETSLEKRLGAVKTAVEKIVKDAEAAKKNYDNITKVVAKGVDDRLVEAAKTTVSAIDNNALTYIWDFKLDGKKIVKSSLKAAWAEDELNAIAKDRDALKKAAMEELSRFYKSTKNEADWQKDFDGLKGQIDNMIARAIVERDYKSKITNLKTKVDNLNGVLAIKDVNQKDVFTKPAGYDDWTKAVKELNDFIDDTTNRRDYTKAELDVDPVGKYTTADKTFTSLKDEFIGQAHKALTALSADAQKNIDTYSYKISAKYQNEPETQKQYEKEFAVIQSELNGYNKTIGLKDYATIVEGYNTIAKNISGINDQVKAKWDKTLNDQKVKVKDNNKDAKKVIDDQIDAVRKNYNDYIAKIEAWKKADFASDDMIASLNANQRVLFDIVGELDAQKKAVADKVAELETAIDEVSDVEFDPNDATKYRFNGENKDGKTYKSIVEEIEGRIKVQIDAAVKTANDRAWTYLTRDWSNGKATLTFNDANQKYNAAKEYIDKGLSESKMTQEAHDSFDKRYQGILDKSQNANVGENYRVDAYNKANDYMNALTLADNIGSISTDYLAKIETAVKAVNDQLEAYTALYQKVATKKVAWTVAKSKEADYQKEYKQVVPDGKDDFVKTKLQEINDALKAFSKKLEDNALTASSLNDEADAVLASFDAGYFQATNYKGYVANNEAKSKADALIAVVKAEITNAKAAIAGYREEVQADANVVIAAAETTVSAQESSVAKDFAAGTLGDTYASIEGALKTASANLKQALADAEKAEKGGNLDLDGDGEIGLGDIVKAGANVDAGVMDGTTFMNFIDAYLQYKKK